MANIGVMITSPAKDVFLMHELNKLNRQRVLFYENMTKHKNMFNYPVLCMADAYGFRGSLVATSLSTANKLATMPCTGQKIFYVRSLEWTRLPNKTYEQLAFIFGQPFKFIAASNEIAHFLKLWDVEAEVISELNFCKYLEKQ